MQSFAETFGGELPEEIIEEIEEEEIFFLLSKNEIVFNIYKIAKNYLSKDYELDSNIILALVRETSAKVTEVLQNIIYIHAGYLDIIIEDIKSNQPETD